MKSRRCMSDLKLRRGHLSGLNGYFDRAETGIKIITGNVSVGSISTELGCKRHVRFPSDSDRIADIVGGPFRAKRLMQRSNWRLYSITSSARATICGGTVRPSALAVLRLMIHSTLMT